MRLASRVGAVPALPGLTSPDQQIDARRSVIGAQADMVGRAFVGEVADAGQGVVHSKP